MEQEQTVLPNSKQDVYRTQSNNDLSEVEMLYGHLKTESGREVYMPVDRRHNASVSFIDDSPHLIETFNHKRYRWKQTEVSPKSYEVCNVFLPKSRQNQLVAHLSRSFKKSVKNHYPDFSEGIVETNPISVVEDIISSLINLDVKQMHIEPSEEKSVSFIFNDKNENKIYYEYFFDLIDEEQDNNTDDEVVIHVFEGQKLKANWAGNLKNSFKHIQSFL